MNLAHSNLDITPIVGKDTGLLIRAFAATLEDENLLVQRSALDLLLQLLRLDSKTIKDANEEDRGIIMRAAYGVLLRRDLSLNRRLFTWLLGPTESSQTQDEFLRTHGLSLLVSTLKVGRFSSDQCQALRRRLAGRHAVTGGVLRVLTSVQDLPIAIGQVEDRQSAFQPTRRGCFVNDTIAGRG
jgi:hypothetical protein